GREREIAQPELLQRRQAARRLFFAVPPLRSARPFLATGCVSRPRSWRLLLEWFLVERLISVRILSGRKRRCAPHRTHPRRRQEIDDVRSHRPSLGHEEAKRLRDPRAVRRYLEQQRAIEA